jgi:hypothetical protein
MIGKSVDSWAGRTHTTPLGGHILINLGIKLADNGSMKAIEDKDGEVMTLIR